MDGTEADRLSVAESPHVKEYGYSQFSLFDLFCSLRRSWWRSFDEEDLGWENVRLGQNYSRLKPSH